MIFRTSAPFKSNFTPLLSWDPSEYSTQCTLNYEVFPVMLVGTGTISGFGWAPDTAPFIYLRWFFFLGLGWSPHINAPVSTCLYTRGEPSSSLGFNLCEAVFSLIPFPLTLVTLVFLGFQLCFLYPGNLLVSLWPLPAKTPGNCFKAVSWDSSRSHHFESHISGITALHVIYWKCFIYFLFVFQLFQVGR